MGTQTRLGSDYFQRAAENPLNPTNWQTLSGFSNVKLANTTQSVGVSAQSTSSFAFAGFLPIGQLTDSWAQTQIFSQGGGQQSGVILRANLANGNCYYFCVNSQTPATQSSFFIFKRSGGSFTQLATANALSYPGDRLKASVVGNVLTLYRNDVQIIQITDSTFAGPGYVGIGMLNGQSQCFQGGDFSSGSNAKLGNLVCDGDSITVGNGTVTVPYTQSLSLTNNTPWMIVNDGIISETLATMLANAPAKIDPQISASDKNVCVIWAGTNDINGGATAAATEANLNSYCSARRAAGWKVIVVKMISRNGLDTQKNAYNALIDANAPSYSDAIVTMPAALAADGAYADTNNFQDGIHPTQSATTNLAAPAIAAKINAVTSSGIANSAMLMGVGT